MINGNPFIESRDKPTRKDQVFKLSIDEKIKEVKPEPTTKEDVRIFEKMCYRINNKT
jgi:hypothetical protein